LDKDTMNPNIELARRFNEQAFNLGNLAAIDEIFAPDYVNWTMPPNLPPGREGTRVFASMLRGAFLDLHIEIENTFADGNPVFTQWTATGTHNGDFPGIPATDKAVRFTGKDIVRIENDQIVAHWDSVDNFGLLRQLGAFH
jgi:steroid delta-isomerase-like uncharacterized protein